MTRNCSPIRHAIEILTILILALPAAIATGADTTPPEVAERDARLRAAEAWMTQFLEGELAPGAAAAIIHDQDVAWSSAYGLADIETMRPVTPDTAFSICSVSKLFTSVGIMRLHEKGLVSLDEPLETYLDDFEIAPTDEATGDPITIRALLAHAAGLPREGIGFYWSAMTFPDPETIRAGLTELERLYTPLSNFQYSNLGMALLGQVIEQVSGQPYDQFIREQVLDPLELDGIHTDLPLHSSEGRFATGYSDHDRKGERTPFPPYQLAGMAPAAGYAASVLDLGRFASWQFRLLESGEPEVLDRVTLRDMHRVHWADPFDPDSPSRGLGFGYFELGGEPAIGHGGYCPGYRTTFGMRPFEKIAVVTMVNANDINPTTLASGIYTIAGEAIVAAADSGDDGEASTEADEDSAMDFSEYEGEYRWPGSPPMPIGSYVIPTGTGLHVIDLYARDPSNGAVDLEHVDGDIFRRKRDEGGLGETLRFIRDERGEITGYEHHGYLSEKIE
ncbi:MAG: serine hydrolase domain-containing protein [Thermoanaerobaculia bacterium]|nr:serine hydrolase domain-containing protein [Thermoanaerobaculia bacterium]